MSKYIHTLMDGKLTYNTLTEWYSFEEDGELIFQSKNRKIAEHAINIFNQLKYPIENRKYTISANYEQLSALYVLIKYAQDMNIFLEEEKFLKQFVFEFNQLKNAD